MNDLMFPSIQCPIIQAPENGYFVKQSDCNNIVHNACNVRCKIGYTLDGPKTRICQINGTWSGPKQLCKVKACSLLKSPENGRITCIDEENRIVDLSKITDNVLPIDTICRIQCDEGFFPVGPKVRNCLPNLKWSGSDTYCKHITPPNIKCPKDVNGVTLPGKKYGFVHWNTETDITDNSNLNIIFWTKPVINDIETFKFKIGKTVITYLAMDAFKNKATCNFTVEIKDIEPPVIENCIDPVPFLVDNDKIDIIWEEPKIYDNSQQIVKVEKNFTGQFSFGVTPVKYVATDLANNTNECVLNITVDKSTCEPISDPVYGKSICDNVPDGVQCVITCEEGYAYNIIDDDDINVKSNSNNDSAIILCNNTNPIWYLNEIPDCSVTEIPNEILQRGTLDFDIDEDSNDNYAHELPTNLTILRRKRDSQNMNKRRSRIQIQFVINGKIKTKSTSKVKHITFNKFNKIQERLSDVEIFMKNNQTLSNSLLNQTKYYIDLKLDRVFAICNNGSVSRRNKCDL
ncbi:sushi, von Willebrand factor type A, EGF and pentraxin domain-containing protein 1-like [Chrysoperla carnea]|uniref:sushi, von Willebrand factor type A, EGF and pentraxin domain-containing protein 1-like n=1 Tax=Chrysoperla carnea TaxID=189513 RepID=UPI001D082221|nr:sushi, von Willebrand factor type A, EGF and pentraxin domain-containing protein 1-like [Chrysoperla carnea]